MYKIALILIIKIKNKIIDVQIFYFTGYVLLLLHKLIVGITRKSGSFILKFFFLFCYFKNIKPKYYYSEYGKLFLVWKFINEILFFFIFFQEFFYHINICLHWWSHVWRHCFNRIFFSFFVQNFNTIHQS